MLRSKSLNQLNYSVLADGDWPSHRPATRTRPCAGRPDRGYVAR